MYLSPGISSSWDLPFVLTFHLSMSTLENHSLSDYAKWTHFCIASIVFQTLDAHDLQNFFGNFKDIEGRLMGVVIFLRMGKKCIIKQLTSVQPTFCNIVTYSVLTEQLRKFVPQERLFTCYTWLISSSRSRPIVPLFWIRFKSIQSEHKVFAYRHCVAYIFIPYLSTSFEKHEYC